MILYARSTKDARVWAASATWNTATQASSGIAAATIRGLPVYRFSTGSRNRKNSVPTAAARPQPMSSPCQPSTPASRPSPAPRRCATRVLVALPRASGIMNISETTFTAIWCPAAGVVPRRAMKMAMKANPVTSTRIDAPSGMPSFRCCFSAGASGRSRPRPHSR